MQRRDLFTLSTLASLAGCRRPATVATPPPPAPVSAFKLAAVRAEIDRVFRITVCLRPFRASGPRLEVERVGDKTVVHNYGHGGSGWSLSWGSSRIAADHALATGENEIGVIGCGALGLTSALLLQQSGAKVTIYAKDRPPDTRSARATGSWTPDSRIALTTDAAASFPAQWERMARFSFARYQTFLGWAGTPVEWTDRYFVAEEGRTSRNQPEAGLSFARYMPRIADITPRQQELAEGTHPFPSGYVTRTSSLSFNIAGLMHQILNDFFLEGGKLVTREFQTPADLAALPQKTLVNCTGYGARALWKDESIVPVRGQINWLIPQPDVLYGVAHKGVLMLGRRDGIVVQAFGSSDMEGYNDANEQPDRAQAERAIGVIRDLYARMRT